MTEKQLLDIIDSILQDLDDMKVSLTDMAQEMEELSKLIQDEYR